jgi:GT2 family glycosyltransferase
MLSILIPVYNYNVTRLVGNLCYQAKSAGINIEIIVYDDNSEMQFKEQNRVIADLPGVKYEEMPQNIGRAGIRNKLASAATYSNLLFIDCDTEIQHSDYLKKYIQYIDKNEVVCGGNAYYDTKPLDPSFYLRWKYGVRREQKPSRLRNLKPWNSFMTNNFLISNEIFNTVRFDESITKYGHEDTFFGIELKRKGIPVIHIDNPLIHMGLEPAIQYLSKTKEGIENLWLLIKTKTAYLDEMVQTIRLLKYYFFLKKLGLTLIYYFVYKLSKKIILKNILSNEPSLLLFDLFKLGYLIEKSLADS